MSPEEVALLAKVGTTLVERLIFYNLVDTILWGIHAALTIAALTSLRQRGVHTKHLMFLFVMLFLLVLLSTCLMALDWAMVIEPLEYGLVKNVELPTAQRWGIASDILNQLQHPAIWLSVSPGLMFVIGDIVVLVRGYLLWTRSKLFFGLPIFLVITFLALTITSNVLGLTTVTIVFFPDPIAITGITATVCSITANAVVTAMIAFQALYFGNPTFPSMLLISSCSTHRQMMRDAHIPGRSTAIRILFYLVEAGVFYFVLQLGNLIVSLLCSDAPPPVNYLFFILQTVTYYVSITYPAIVILLVRYNKTLIKSGISGSKSPPLDAGTHISFGRPDIISQGPQISSNGDNTQHVHTLSNV